MLYQEELLIQAVAEVVVVQLLIQTVLLVALGL
jgi:hypothetical protein